MRRIALVALGAVLLAGSPTTNQAAPQPPDVNPPAFDATNFTNSTAIDNPYFPLVPGTTFVYEGVPGGQRQRNEVFVTHDTKMIQGVNCVVVQDRVWIKGVLEEDTFDWYAQDRDGNVWYMGEDASSYKNGVLVGHEGSWEAGVGGAQPGYVMQAHFTVGDPYRQEYLAGEAEDMAEVTSISGTVSVPYGSWSGNALVTKEWSPLERSVVENKYYARGVGLVKSETVRGGSETTFLVNVKTD
jgi:hypothetical protein